MLIDNFNPLNKVYLYKFASDNCYFRDKGYCIIEMMSNDELLDYKVESLISFHRECNYCLWLAKCFLFNTINKPAWIYRSNACNHYVFDDGQHRTCVYARLIKRGFNIKLPVEYFEFDSRCKYCCVVDEKLNKHPFGNIPLLKDAIREQIKELVYKEYQVVELSF